MNSPRAPLPGLSFGHGAILFVTLLALALGGATQLGAQTVLAALMGVCLLIAPAWTSPGRTPCVLAALLFALSLAAFLPATWGPLPEWRRHLVDDLHFDLPNLRTPQPWITAQACALLFTGLAWSLFLFSHRWNSEQRSRALAWLCGGVGLLAAVAVACFAAGWRMPGWMQEENRGWFPNRNQTSDVLAVVGVLNYALIFDRFKKRRASAWLFLATLSAIGAGLVVCLSRAGILLFFGGMVLWHLWPAPRRRRSRHRVKWPALGASLVLLLLALFLFFGGATLGRLQPHAGAKGPPLDDFRTAIQADAFRFSLQQPWLGVGLGNFAPLFATARQASINQDRVIHPESDWLWMAGELGWFAPLLLLAAIDWWLRGCLPFELRPGESLRRAAMVATLLFLLHSLADVAGHRLGSLCVGLLLASLALPHRRLTAAGPRVPLLFRLAGLALLGIAGAWTYSQRVAPFPPTTATLAQQEDALRAAVKAGDSARIVDLANAALRLDPLSLTFYFQRATGEAFQPGQVRAAMADFDRARALEPHWVQIAVDEGTVWLQADQPDLAATAWDEALRRDDPADAPSLYAGLLDRARPNPVARAAMGEIAPERLDYLIIFLGGATRPEAQRMIAYLLTQDPELKTLNSTQRATLFRNWWGCGDQADLTQRLLAHPDWQSDGWPYLAQAEAQQHDFKSAWELVARFAPKPPIPTLVSTQWADELRREFYGHPDNIPSGIMLYLAQMKADDADDALATLRLLEKQPGHPAYVPLLEARIWAQRQQWELAWNAWLSYSQP